MGDERWHVSDGGKVRQVVVRHVAEAEAEAGAGAEAEAGAGAAGAGGAGGALPMVPRFVMVAHVRGGQQPFVTRDAHLFRTPPTEAQLDGLKVEAASPSPNPSPSPTPNPSPNPTPNPSPNPTPNPNPNTVEVVL